MRDQPVFMTPSLYLTLNLNEANIITALAHIHAHMDSSSDISYTTGTSSCNSVSTRSVIVSPCAACKILRRRCVQKCVLAPYFPPNDPLKFTIAHRVFGASNIIKMLQELPECQREDAVSSMVYEGRARIRDPVYGCAGTICQLHKQVDELQTQLAKAQAEIVNMQCQQESLVALSNCKMTGMETNFPLPPSSPSIDSLMIMCSLWSPDPEPLWK